MKVNALIEMINDECGSHNYYQACGLAKELWPALIHHLGDLRLVAQQMVEHYRDEARK